MTGTTEELTHPIPTGITFNSLGQSWVYRVVGPVCRLYDREELPWPSCSLQWRGKQPSWRRVGPRFVPDMATRRSPSYCVEMFGGRPFIFTFYHVKMGIEIQRWWYSKRNERNEYPN